MSKIAQDKGRLPGGLTLTLLLAALALLGVLVIWGLPGDALSTLFKHIGQAADVGAGYLVLFPFFAIFIKKVYKKGLIELCFKSSEPLKDVLIGLGASPLLVLLLLIENSVLPGGVYLPRGYSLVLFMGVAISLGPVMEEAFYRGVIYSILRRRVGVWLGVAISAAIFAISHFPEGAAEWVPYFLTGVPLALLYERRGSLLPSVAAHSAANLGAILWGLAFYP
jgi:membrane protease YdiL (CAAX protease family)